MSRFGEIKRLIEEKKKPLETADYLEEKYFEAVFKWNGAGPVPRHTYTTHDNTVRDMAAEILHERGYTCKVSSFRENGYPVHKLEFFA